MTIPTDPNTQQTTAQPAQPAGTGSPPPATPPTNGQGETPPPATPQNWEEYLGGLPEDIQGLYNEHITGLRNTVAATREERDTLQKQLKELGGQLEAGSEARQKLDSITATLEAESSRADFYEEAATQGVSNLKLAWLAVQADKENLTRRGRVDFDALKAQMPELFRAAAPPATPPGHAGAGTQTPPQKPADMDTFIRRSAGIIR